MHVTQDDLDLDLFCRLIIREDIDHLKHFPCFNAYRERARGIVGIVAEEKCTEQEDDVGVLDGLP
jgi:hypothetical protein